MAHKKDILFLLNNHITYTESHCAGDPKSSGLYNSVKFISKLLEKLGFDTEIRSVVTERDITDLLTIFEPRIVCIEAIWLDPEILTRLSDAYPDVSWIVRIHSNGPFLATEGTAIEWIRAYASTPGVFISANNAKMLSELKSVNERYQLLLPNYYPLHTVAPKPLFNQKKKHINIGCFGSIRVLKNTMVQAMAAIKMCNDQGLTLTFHINTERMETKARGEQILRNIRALFTNTEHKLVEHGWLDRKHFLNLVSTMDACMQVSLTETFNITAADAVLMNVPIVVSHEIDWLPSTAKANPTEINDIIDKLISSITRDTRAANRKSLDAYNEKAANRWKSGLIDVMDKKDVFNI